MANKAIQAVEGSFRDPSGFVYVRDGALLRQVNARYRLDYDHLLRSGLYDRLQSQGLLIPHVETGLDFAASPDKAYKIIMPERLPFISYPYEWCFSQLRDAANVTLKIQKAAIACGMTLKDASAFNIQFLDGRPLLIDTLSFQRYRPGETWAAYRQFCQHFLAPLALMSLRDPRLLHLWRSTLDGIELDFALKVLPWRSRLRFGLLLHLYLHAYMQPRWTGLEDRFRSSPRRAFSETSMLHLVQDLERVIEGLPQPSKSSRWSDYYTRDANYTDAASVAKERIVAEYVSIAKPSTAWDFGANTGHFTEIINKEAPECQTVAWDYDFACVEIVYRRIQREANRRLLPLMLDLTNPTPSLGFAGKERLSLAERGPVDLILMLAITHHLTITGNIPFELQAAWLAGLCRWAIIEFVPKDDPKAIQLLRNRDDIFDDYHEDQFVNTFSNYFSMIRKDSLPDSSRKLLLLRNSQFAS